MTTLLTGGGTRGRESLDDDVDLERDRALVNQAQDGDRSAFDDLYTRYYRRLYRFCLRRLHDSHEAEDVTQEAFSRAWRALPTFAGDRRFYPWLSVIASHLCTDVLRRRNRSTPVAEFHQSNVASGEDTGEDIMLAAVDSEMVAKAFRKLSDRHQRILHLREGSGWSYQRIADHEGVGITAVETLLWRARQALKREFASLAGADGRTAAWIGGIFSLASLRKMFGMPHRVLHRIATASAKGTAITAGSAVAATAMVIGATLSAPGNTVTPDAGAGPTVSQEMSNLLTTTAVPTSGALPTSLSESPLAPTGDGTTSSGSALGAQSPVAAVPAGQSISGGVGSLGGVVSQGATGTTSTLNNTVQTLSGTVDSLLGSVSGGSLSGVTGPVSDITSVLGSVTGAVSGAVSGATAGSQAGGTAISGTAGITGVVGGLLGTATGALGGSGGGLLGN